MYRAILMGTASFIFSGLITGKTSFASEMDFAVDAEARIAPASESGQERRALRQLAVTLSAGRAAWRSFHDSNPDAEEAKHPLSPTIPDMNCNVDDIASYVSCYGAASGGKEQAERRFTGLINELQDVLSAERWTGAETEPRVGSIRSYTFGDQISDAQIDIDISTHWSPDEEISYVVTIFGWTASEPQL